MIYHSGELAVQARAGVRAEAEALGKGIGALIKPAAREFLQHQRLAIAATVDANGKVWASLLTGEPGFVQAIAEPTVRINTVPVPGDPFSENLRLNDDIGLLAIDLSSRRRLRLNGKAEILPDSSIEVHTRQVYFNCPKYIQLRQVDTEGGNPRGIAPTEPTVPEPQLTETLTPEQHQWIARADTFFIASLHPESGADASHRGGNSGFVRVLNPTTLVLPDYSGNNMFNTLGNLTANPASGLLFVDFERGSTLQLTGKASIIWERDRIAEFPGAERLVEFQIERTLGTVDASPLRWRFVEFSPFNPSLEPSGIASRRGKLS